MECQQIGHVATAVLIVVEAKHQQLKPGRIHHSATLHTRFDGNPGLCERLCLCSTEEGSMSEDRIGQENKLVAHVSVQVCLESCMIRVESVESVIELHEFFDPSIDDGFNLLQLRCRQIVFRQMRERWFITIVCPPQRSSCEDKEGICCHCSARGTSDASSVTAVNSSFAMSSVTWRDLKFMGCNRKRRAKSDRFIQQARCVCEL